MESSIFGEVGRNMLYYWLKENTVDGKDQLLLLRKFLLLVWQLPDHLIQQLNMLIDALNLNEPFVGVHVRWGDKKSESTLIPSSLYAHHLQEIASKANTKTIFVMSDSSLAIEELSRQLPTYDIRTTTPPSWNGNDLKGWKEMKLEEKEAHTVLLILELTIMSQAEGVVCMMSSNVCRLLQMLRAQPPATLRGIEMTGTDSSLCKLFGWMTPSLQNRFCITVLDYWPFWRSQTPCT